MSLFIRILKKFWFHLEKFCLRFFSPVLLPSFLTDIRSRERIHLKAIKNRIKIFQPPVFLSHQKMKEFRWRWDLERVTRDRWVPACGQKDNQILNRRPAHQSESTICVTDSTCWKSRRRTTGDRRPRTDARLARSKSSLML